MNMQLPKVLSKAFVKKSLDEVSRKLSENPGVYLTVGSIACNLGALAFVYKKAIRIKVIISETKAAVENYPDIKNELYKKAFIDLAKAAGPAFLLEVASIICTIKLERRNMKNEAKIAELTATAMIAQNALSEYDAFKKEVRKDLGDEKYKQLQNDATENKFKDVPYPTTVLVNVGENLCYFPYIDKWFSGTASDMEAAMQEFNHVLERNQDGYGHESSRGNEIVLIEDICSRLKLLDRSQFAAMTGYESQRTKHIDYWIGSGHINDTLYFTLNLETEPYAV